MRQRWRAVTFVHWRCEPAAVQRVLPSGLEVQVYDGSAWVGLVAFRMDGVRPPGLPAVPWLSSFPETNVRTYVRGPGGGAGIWFLSLDATRLAAVMAGRAGYGLRYHWSAMRVEVAEDRVVYESRRRWPGPRGAGCRLGLAVGGPLVDPGSLDLWLTARYRLYTRVAGRLVTAAAEHPAWRLRGASLTRLEDDLLRTAGLPAVDASPVVHYSDGTDARIGTWRTVRAATRPRPRTPRG